jgi:hypothetical protein
VSKPRSPCAVTAMVGCLQLPVTCGPRARRTAIRHLPVAVPPACRPRSCSAVHNWCCAVAVVVLGRGGGGEGGAKEPGPHGRALWRVGVLTATLNNGLHSVQHRYRTSLQLYIGLQHSLEGHMFDCGSRGINLCCRKGSGCGSSGVVPAWGMPGIRDTQKYTASRCCSPRGVLMLRCCTVWLRSAALAAGCVAAGARYACCC